ncbi:MAG: signal peptidase II [Chloroflexi bacterium]|nr:signal peptidase II [Chloroflexota bacterium]MCY3588740.1 signal peptidase II [Chloroflexota bacterium]MCY3687080.1 signal peptidase II [Chloroflexota bacterium]MDE2708615.1 signal peptidase II [Chloroflexota bacterium]
MAERTPTSTDAPLSPAEGELEGSLDSSFRSTEVGPPDASPLLERAAEGGSPPTHKPGRSHRRFVLLAALVVIFDQVTKVILRETLELGDREWLAEFFAFSHVANDGGAFGVFGGQNTVLAVSAVVAIGVVAIYYFFPPMNHWLVRSGLALILGGAIGNLLDRIYQGHVTDFIDFIHFPAFNVADAAINVGVAAIVTALLFGDLLKRNPRSPRSP